MNTTISEKLENELKKFLGETVPAQAAKDIHAALALADTLKSKGFAFLLKDLCPGNPDQTHWQAVFPEMSMNLPPIIQTLPWLCARLPSGH